MFASVVQLPVILIFSSSLFFLELKEIFGNVDHNDQIIIICLDVDEYWISRKSKRGCVHSISFFFADFALFFVVYYYRLVFPISANLPIHFAVYFAGCLQALLPLTAPCFCAIVRDIELELPIQNQSVWLLTQMLNCRIWLCTDGGSNHRKNKVFGNIGGIVFHFFLFFCFWGEFCGRLAIAQRTGWKEKREKREREERESWMLG